MLQYLRRGDEPPANFASEVVERAYGRSSASLPILVPALVLICGAALWILVSSLFRTGIGLGSVHFELVAATGGAFALLVALDAALHPFVAQRTLLTDT